MAFPFSSAEASAPWSIEAWCASQSPSNWSRASVSTQEFLERLACPNVHPFCTQFDDSTYPIPGVPAQGPLLHQDHLETAWDVVVSAAALTIPPLLAMAELWLRLFACLVAPWGVTQLITQQSSKNKGDTAVPTRLTALLTLASTLVLATDSLYLLEFGPQLGRGLLVTSMALVWFQPKHLIYHRALVLLALIAVTYLTANSPATSMPHEGLYYDTSSPMAQSIVDRWPAHYRTYSDGTPWFPTGDSRTGLPFLIYSIPKPPVWNRVWLPVDEASSTTEVVALDIAFPASGYRSDRPVYLVLHGLNGGSQEAFVQDFTLRRIAADEQATVVVMVARGLMDLPVRGWNIFHGARWEDAHAASRAVRRAIGDDALLVGVGYSMGAIVLSNLVSRVGEETALSAAVAVSGGLDMRQELKFKRAERLWQPLITPELRDTFVVGKFGERVRSRLSKTGLKKLMRATHVTAVDVAAVVEYNGYRNVEHYYAEMSALGDVPEEEFTLGEAFDPSRRILNVAIPFCVVHALDDPLVTWETVGSGYGLRHPTNLTAANSNIFVVLTKGGGHVGWSTGLFPHADKWKWMSDISKSFADAVQGSGR